MLFEVLGGDLPGEILKRMPAKSKVVCVGNLTHTKVSFDSEDLHWADKDITGLMMFRWVSSLSDAERLEQFALIANDLKAEGGPKIFGTKIIKTVKLEDWESVINDSGADASQGKYLVEI